MDAEFLCEKRLAELNPYYHALVKNTTFVLYNALDRYKLYFPDFTDHTILHSMQVMWFCNQLIGENIYQLNDDELFVLIMSAYLHDSGMGISDADYKELYNTVVSTDYRIAHPHTNIKETIRSFHHVFSKKIIYKYAELFEIPTQEHIDAIAIVSEAHRKTDLFDETILPSVIKISNGNEIRLPYLAALIRLADELDIAADRNLGTDQSGQQTIFKIMHRSIRRLHIFPDRFILDVDADDPALLYDIKQEIKKLEDTLECCADVVKKRTPFRICQDKLEIQFVNKNKKHITVLDTDLGTDDACALLLSKFTGFNPDFIVASYGNTTSEGACRNAVLLKKYLGLKCGIVCGLTAPDNAPTEKNDFHGTDGLAGLSSQMMQEYQITETELSDVISFTALEKELKTADAITYVTIGTMTNLSTLLQNQEIVPRFSGIYVMGGGIKEFNCSHDTEFNFSKDPKSVKMLLSSGLNITLFTLDVTNRQQLDETDIDDLEQIGTYPEYIGFLRHNLKSNRDFNGIPAAVLHDTLPILYLSMPELFSLEDIRLSSDEYGHIEVSGEGEALHICTNVNDKLVRDTLKQAFLQKEKE